MFESMPQRTPHGRNLRKGRYSESGIYYFLTTATHNRRPLFSESQLAKLVLDALEWLSQNREFGVDAAVVMPDHVHFAGTLGNGSLSAVMHSLKSYTANRMSARGVSGKIWQSGYHDHALRDEEDYRSRVRYLLDNPVRANLVEDFRDYPYLIAPEFLSEEE